MSTLQFLGLVTLALVGLLLLAILLPEFIRDVRDTAKEEWERFRKWRSSERLNKLDDGNNNQNHCENNKQHV